MFELDNKQREYFGLDPILENWDRVQFKGDTYRPDSFLFYDGDVIKKHVISTDAEYKEYQYNDKTRNREYLLPKTKRGKEKKLTPAVLEARHPTGIYLSITSKGGLKIASYTTHTTFYSRNWEIKESSERIEKLVKEFIIKSPHSHFSQIDSFRKAKRKNVNYKSGDFFSFKISRNEYAFGRILLDINRARKKKLLPENHGLSLLMGPPVLIKLYAFISERQTVDINFLKSQKSLPSDYIMDNVLFYGEYKIIGHLPLEPNEFDFPISYGRRIDQVPNVFLQWGLIHLELPMKNFNKFTSIENENLPNPYGYYGIGYRSKFGSFEIADAINNEGNFNYSYCEHYKTDYDLRNPKNAKIRYKILKRFGLNPSKDYFENSKELRVKDILDFIDEM